jgi:hypothetical protein
LRKHASTSPNDCRPNFAMANFEYLIPLPSMLKIQL